MWWSARDPVESKCSKHMSQMLFLVMDWVADGTAGGTGEGADCLDSLVDAVGDWLLGFSRTLF